MILIACGKIILENVFIITGMSNKQWEDEMKDKTYIKILKGLKKM